MYSFGVLTRVVTYLVDKRQSDEHHQMILLTPVSRWIFPFTYLSSWIGGSRLEHLKVVNNGFLELTIMTNTGLQTSIGRVNNFTSCTVDTNKFEHLSSVHRTSKIGLTHMQVKSVLDVKDEKCYFSALLLDFMRTCEPRLELTFGANYVRSYQFRNIYYDDEAPPAMVSFMKPIIDGAFVPVRSMANDYQLVKSRIIDVRSDATLDPFMLKCAREFIALCGASGDLIPVDFEVVYDRQKRPTQRRILHEADFCTPKHTNNLFMKREAYGKPNDPRPISTINGVSKTKYSRYTYALDPILKNLHWYAFGTTPRGVCIRVAEIGCHAVNLAVTDYSRFDGHVSPALRTFEEMFMIACFAREYHDELLELMRNQYRLLSTLGELAWIGGYERLSGSPETSPFNTVDNAFIAYCYKRSEGCSVEQAWEELGIYGGDDGLTLNVKPKRYIRIASRLGQVLDIRVITRGKTGVRFLNRIYGPGVWFGDPNSCCDVLRAVSKFHTAVNMPFTITNQTKLLDKAYAYWLSDRNTPLIGEFVTSVCCFLPFDYVFRNLSSVYSAQYLESEQYVNESVDWMLDACCEGIAPEGLETFFMWLHDTHILDDMLQPPTIMFVEALPHNDQDVVVDDVLIKSKRKRKNKNKNKTGQKTRSAQVETSQGTATPQIRVGKNRC
jgi:hypothetical protein